jgi:hypothetical protein
VRVFDQVDDSSDTSSLSAALRHGIRHLRGVGRWPVVEADVYSCEEEFEDTSDGPMGHFEIRFTFSVDDQLYVSSFSLPSSGTARLFAAGDKVRIRFNPKNPEQTLYSEAWSDSEIFWLWVSVPVTIFVAHWVVTGFPWFASR